MGREIARGCDRKLFGIGVRSLIPLNGVNLKIGRKMPAIQLGRCILRKGSISEPNLGCYAELFITGWVMRRQEALTVLANHQNTLKTFGVKSLMIFGSVARNEARIDSDVDLLVEFDRPVGLFTFIRLKRYLEEILESSVDLGTPDSLKPYLQEPVFREAIRAF
jgi:uncharacterized protein